MVADATNVYWAPLWGGPIQVVPLAGGAVTTLVPDVFVTTLAVDGESVYWGDPTGVTKVSKRRGTPVALPRIAGAVQRIVLDETRAYSLSSAATAWRITATAK